MIKLSQLNEAWKWKTIGKSKSTIGRWGCTITSLSMASDYFKCYRDPAWMAKYLEFAVDKVIWSSIEKVLCFKFKWRYYKHEQKIFTEALRDPATVLLLNVKNGAHWVIATKKVPFGYWVTDPLGGKASYYFHTSVVGGTVLIRK